MVNCEFLLWLDVCVPVGFLIYRLFVVAQSQETFIVVCYKSKDFSIVQGISTKNSTRTRSLVFLKKVEPVFLENPMLKVSFICVLRMLEVKFPLK